MGIFDEENFIEITQDDLADASIVSKNADEKDQKRAFANVLGARLGIKYLNSLSIKSDNYNSLYTIRSILKDIDIADILTSNNIKADIRLVKDEHSLCVPKAHYDYNITPDVYIFIVPAPDFMSADFVGAIAPDEVDKSITDGKYYFVSNDAVYNEQSLKSVITSAKTRAYQPATESEIAKAQSLLVNFIDGDILQNEKLYLYDILKRSNELRLFFKDFEHFEYISDQLAHTEEILNDSVLDILGAQELYKDEDGNIGADIDLDELAKITATDFVEDYVDNNKDENMSEDNIIEDEFEELPDIDSSDENSSILDELPTDEELANLAINNDIADTTDIIKEIEDEVSEITDLNGFEKFEGFEGLDTSDSLDDADDEDMTNLVDLEDFEKLNSDEAVEDNEELSDVTENDSIIEPEFNEIEDLSELEPTEKVQEIIEEASDFELDDLSEVVPTEDITNVDISEEHADDGSSFELEELTETTSIQDDNADEIIEADSLVLDDFSQSDSKFEEEEEEENNLTLDESFEIENLTEDVLEEENFETLIPESNNDVNINNMQEETTDNDTTFDTGNEEIDTNESSDYTDNSENNFSLSTDAPINLTLPELKPDGDLPFFEEFSESENEVEAIAENNVQDISTDNINPEDTEENSGFTPEDFTDSESFDNQENTSLDDIAEEVNFDNITEDLPEISGTIDDLEFQPIENDANEVNSDNTDNTQEVNNTESDDMSGLEEFTMDMAEATEKANPNLLNPNFAMGIEDTEQNSLDLESFNFNMDNELEPLETIEPVPDSDSTLQSTAQETSSNNNDNDNINGINLDDINLDELDNEENDYSSTDSQNINIDDIDIDNINIDNIDVDSINLDELDIENNYENNNNEEQPAYDNQVSTLENIPEMSPENNNIDYSYNQEQQPINDIPLDVNSVNDYTPDFENNDKNTIETLYQDNNQNMKTDDAMDNAFNQNQVNMENPQPVKQKKKTSPLLGIVLIVLICAFGFVKKDFIMEKINATRGVTEQQDQNMPIEGETQEDKEDQELLEDNSQNNSEQDEQKQGIGEIPGEAGGPQDAASMEASLNQNKSKINKLPDQNYAKTPEPLSSSQIKRLYWEVPQDLTYNESIVKYLKTVGKTMKFAIESDLLNTTELPYSNKMIINIEIKKDGTADNIQTSVSSGSKQIDSIVLQTVNAALKYVKAPTSECKNDSYVFSLIINF
ncbi:hypothetical protein IKE67_08060 [bacterium]|nr:hypothetical protein [bacterium]